jgi:hypothetical protein
MCIHQVLLVILRIGGPIILTDEFKSLLLIIFQCCMETIEMVGKVLSCPRVTYTRLASTRESFASASSTRLTRYSRVHIILVNKMYSFHSHNKSLLSLASISSVCDYKTGLS